MSSLEIASGQPVAKAANKYAAAKPVPLPIVAEAMRVACARVGIEPARLVDAIAVRGRRGRLKATAVVAAARALWADELIRRGYRPTEVGRALGVNPRQVNDWRQMFRALREVNT